jgi:hypothetical protein
MNSSAQAYRERAEKIVALAEHTDGAAARAELLALAESFKLLGDRATRLGEYAQTAERQTQRQTRRPLLSRLFPITKNRR